MPEPVAALLRRCFERSPEARPAGTQAIVSALKTAYKEVSTEDYLREEPKGTALLADGLNNQAVSLLDIGKEPQAEELYAEALKLDPHHPEATYNRGLLL